MPRKEKKVGPPTMSLVFVGLACFFFVGAGGGFLWNKTQIHTLGQQIHSYETRLEEAKRRRLMMERTYAAMCSPVDLDERVKRMRLELGPPQPDHIIVLPESPGAATDEKLIAKRVSASEEGRN
jgi:hypothetical protein